ncbi:MAG: M48 family metallopeptidase [Candidatus Sumerlaeia bacterium]
MWEAIESNRRRSFVLIVLMGALLVMLGFSIGAYIDLRQGGPIGALAAVGVWLVMWIVAVASGDSILLSQAGAEPVSHEQAPQLFNVVEEMKIAAGLPAMPEVYVIDSPEPNAFAVGRTPEKSAVAVTSGLIKRLHRDELQGVIGHEIGHILNRDTRFMTQAAVMLGAIVMISDIFLRVMRDGGGRRSSRGRGQGQQIFVIIAIVLAILAPIAARMLWFACSRRREYLADATSARLTRFPEGLASALEKISGHALRGSSLGENRALAPLYIVSPLHLSSLFSTHPPIEDRIQILRSLGGNAGLAAYQAAYEGVHKRGVIGSQTLRQAETVAVRPPNEDEVQKLERVRETLGILDHAAGLAPIACACGLNLKIRANDPRASITCPRCGTKHTIL